MSDPNLVKDREKVNDGNAEGTSVSHADDAEFEKRVRERLEASYQRDEALASARGDTYQQIAEAKRAGEPDRKLMEIARAGLRRLPELLPTRPGPGPDMPTAIELLATHDLPISELAKAWTASNERFFEPPYDGNLMTQTFANTDVLGDYGESSANKTTGDFRVLCFTHGRPGLPQGPLPGRSLFAWAGFWINFGLDVPPGRPRLGKMRLLPTFSGLDEAYMVAASHMTAKSSCKIHMEVYDQNYSTSVSSPEVSLWDEQNLGDAPGAETWRYSQTKTVSSDWFPVNSVGEYHLFITVDVRVEGHPDGDNSFAEAVGQIAGKLSSIRVSQYLTD
jgi:hypothetical protein